MNWPVRVGPSEASSARAMPKSITRGPVGDSSTLDGLRSRCTIPAPWIAVSAVAMLTASASRSPPLSGPPSRTAFSSDGPATYSVTTYSGSPSSRASSTAAVQNRRTCRAAVTSLRNRSWNASSSASSALMTLTATRRPEPSSPRKTVPMPPRPRRPSSR